MAPQNVLITAAGGHIGQHLVPLLAEKDPQLRLVLPTSNAGRLQSSLPIAAAGSANIVIEQGSIKDPRWFQHLLESYNVDTVFLCLTGTDELFITMNILDCLVRAGTVKHLIYLSACGDFVSPQGVANVMKKCTAAHAVIKTTVEQKLMYADLPFSWTTLGPTLFFINDLRSKRSLLERGLFDEPLGETGVSRVAPSDIALAVRNCVVDQGAKFAGRKIMIGSKHAYKGTEVAKLWGEALGKEVRMYGSDAKSLDVFEEHLGAVAHGGGDEGRAWARDLRLMYEMLAEVAFGIDEKQYQEQVELLGKEAEDYEAWVRKTAASWK